MIDKPVLPGQLRSLWQSMPTDPITITAEEMRRRASAFEKRIRRRNRIEYGACVFVVVVFSWYATWSKPATILWPIANIMIALGAVLIAFNLHRRASAPRTQGSASLTGLIDQQRAELTRQRNALTSVWWWYIMPLVPGVALWLAAFWIARPTSSPAIPVGLIGIGLVFALVCGCIILLNLLGAARLQRMIDDLDRYREQK